MDAMTSDRYTELVAFLARKFEAADRRTEEARRHASVLFEQAADERRTMAEGIEARFNARFDALDRKVARIEPLERKVDSLDAFVRATLGDHETRIRGLE
jgi:hypothetical protein